MYHETCYLDSGESLFCHKSSYYYHLWIGLTLDDSYSKRPLKDHGGSIWFWMFFGIGSQMIDICAVLWKRQVEKGKPKASSSCTPPKQVWNTTWRKACVKTFLQQIVICTTGNMLSPTLLPHLSHSHFSETVERMLFGCEWTHAAWFGSEPNFIVNPQSCNLLGTGRSIVWKVPRWKTHVVGLFGRTGNGNMFNCPHWTQLKLSRKLHQLGWNSWQL